MALFSSLVLVGVLGGGLSVSDAVVGQEACATHHAVFKIALPVIRSRLVSVEYTTADGSAHAGSDYTARSGTLSFDLRHPTASIVVPVRDVLAPGPDTTFFLNLSHPRGATIADGQGVATIHPPSVTKCDDADPCTHDFCDTAARGCRHVDVNACALASCELGSCSSDTDGDGLSDAWEQNGYIDNNCNGVRDVADGDLPAADADVPDIYLRYDWMGYGREENGCATDAECPAVWGNLGHAGETCTGPAVPGSLHSCEYACGVDADCTSRAGAASHVGETCLAGVCQHTHDPELVSPGAVQAVVDAFTTRGFNLHVARGQALPHSHVLSFRLLADPVYADNVVSDGCEGGSVGSGTAGAGLYAESVYDLKASSFDSRQKPAYRYMILGHYNTCDSDAHCQACPAPTIGVNPDGTPKLNTPVFGQSGLAEVNGNDAIVTLAPDINDIGTAPNIYLVGGTFMHELGHMLGLRHGGGSDVTGDAEDTPTHRPNYLSVMNLLYQKSGIVSSSATGTLTPPFTPRLDYSTQTLPMGGNTPGALDETDLAETAGLGSGNADVILFDGYDAGQDSCPTALAAPSQGPVDWDQDAATTNAHASVDLNRADHPGVTACPSSVRQVLKGHTDWGPALGQSVFVYDFQCHASTFADGAPPIQRLAQAELSPGRTHTCTRGSR